MAKAPKDRNKLPDDVKTRIVIANASYEKPAAVVALIKAEHGVDVTPQQVEAYDPTKVAGKALSKQWRDLFDEARKTYLADTASIGIASKVYRLRAMERLYDKVSERNPVMALHILEQAAKEEGGAFGARRQLEHSLSNPLMDLARHIAGSAFRPTEAPTKAK
jgi:hypothetical protein